MILQLSRIMKKHRATKTLLAFLSCCLILGSGLFLTDLSAETDTQAKIRLMSEALTARNAGDLETARDKLEQLREIAPDDEGVRRLLENVETAMAEADDEEEVEPAAQPARRDVRRIELWSRAVSARGEADFDEARRIAETIGEEYPDDTRVEPFLDSLADRRVALEEARRIEDASTDARAVLQSAPEWIAAGRYDRTIDEINAVLDELPENVRTVNLIAELEKKRSEATIKKALAQLREGRMREAGQTYAQYEQYEETNREARQTAREVERGLDDPSYIPIEDVSPDYPAQSERVRELLLRGRAQFINGDLQGAEDSFRRVEAMDANNPQAKAFLRRISDERAAGAHLNREKTRAQLLEEVADAWQRPQIYLEEEEEIEEEEEFPPEAKLRNIVIPSVNFSEVPLRRVVSTLNDISREYDDEDEGVNLVLRDPDGEDPEITIQLRNMALGRILDFILEDTGFMYEVMEDVVVISPGEDIRHGMETEIFAIDRATLIRMTGADAAGVDAPPDDPFADPGEAEAAPATDETSRRLQNFLRRAGVGFPSDASLVYDGSAIIVTNSRRNLDRIRNLLSRYADIRQVEIEARFLEVQQGSLDELGFNLDVEGGGRAQFDASGNPIVDQSGNPVMGQFRQIFGTDNRRLSDVRTGIESGGELRISRPGEDITVPQAPPQLPGTVGLAGAAGDFARLTGSIGDFGVEATIRALSRQTGSDLLSAPKVTVLSGERAEIVVAQEFRYPDTFSDVQSQVSQAGGTAAGAGAAGVTITAGTPQDFQTRNIGVELAVTPTVEDDDRSISLELSPRVTEFEGFVEYGGPSVAIQGDTTVTVPSGFFQPIFATRTIDTKVTIWDGATLVMGGLTREEVRTVTDKVPVLGDIPLLGRLFRSEGEASSKRNLLIFVTANLVTPGGSLKNQELRNVAPGSTYQAPTHVTPGGPSPRIQVDDD